MHVMFTIATQCLCCSYATQCLCCCYVVLSLTCGRRHFVLVMATQCLCCCYVRVLSLTCGRRHIEFNVATQCLCCCYVRVLSLTCGRRHFEFNVATQCLCDEHKTMWNGFISQLFSTSGKHVRFTYPTQHHMGSVSDTRKIQHSSQHISLQYVSIENKPIRLK